MHIHARGQVEQSAVPLSEVSRDSDFEQGSQTVSSSSGSERPMAPQQTRSSMCHCLAPKRARKSILERPVAAQQAWSRLFAALVALQESPKSLLERPKAPKPARSSWSSAQWLPQQARSRLFERPVALQQARSSLFERPVASQEALNELFERPSDFGGSEIRVFT